MEQAETRRSTESAGITRGTGAQQQAHDYLFYGFSGISPKEVIIEALQRQLCHVHQNIGMNPGIRQGDVSIVQLAEDIQSNVKGLKQANFPEGNGNAAVFGQGPAVNGMVHFINKHPQQVQANEGMATFRGLRVAHKNRGRRGKAGSAGRAQERVQWRLIVGLIVRRVMPTCRNFKDSGTIWRT